MFNAVAMPQEPSPQLGYSYRQTNAKANTLQAQADSAFDANRMNAGLDRRGFSRSGGQSALGMLQAGQQYAAGSAAANQSRMSDAYHNANLRLQDQSRRQDFGLALAGLNEQMAQDRFDGAMPLANSVLKALGGLGPR